MATNADKAKARKGIKARQDAIRALIAKYQSEFDEMHARNRVEAGLSPRTQGPTKEQLEERIRRQRGLLEKWQNELDLVG